MSVHGFGTHLWDPTSLKTRYNYFTSSDPHHISIICLHASEEHVALAVSFVVLEFACGSSGCVMLCVVVVCCGCVPWLCAVDVCLWMCLWLCLWLFVCDVVFVIVFVVCL